VALTQCLQCSGTFEDSARSCPGCGFPVPIQATKDMPQESVAEPAAAIASIGQTTVTHTGDRQPELAGANNWIVAVAVFLGMVVFGLSLNGADSSSQTTKFDDGKSWAVTMAQAFVKERLKSPASASFPWSFDEYRVSNIGKEWSVSGYVDATNSFNANIRTHWSLRMRDEGENWRLLSIDIRE
jgi:hypothetical protein